MTGNIYTEITDQLHQRFGVDPDTEGHLDDTTQDLLASLDDRHRAHEALDAGDEVTVVAQLQQVRLAVATGNHLYLSVLHSPDTATAHVLEAALEVELSDYETRRIPLSHDHGLVTAAVAELYGRPTTVTGLDQL